MDSISYPTEKIQAVMHNIKRFSINPSLFQESNAEHSFIVSFLIIEAFTKFPDFAKYLDLGVLLTRATLHDLAECITSDIPSIAKRTVNEEDFSVFSDIELKSIDTLCEGRPEMFKSMLSYAIKFDDVTDLEQVFFKTFDFLSVAYKVLNELYLRNSYYIEVAEEITSVILKLKQRIKEVIDKEDTSFKKEGFELLFNYYDEVVTPLLTKLNTWSLKNE